MGRRRLLWITRLFRWPGGRHKLFVVTWVEFVRAMTESAGTRGHTHFVMSTGEHVILELTGTLLVNDRHIELGVVRKPVPQRRAERALIDRTRAMKSPARSFD